MLDGVPSVWVITFHARPRPVLRGFINEDNVKIIFVVVVELGLEFVATRLKILELVIVTVLEQLFAQEEPAIIS